ncbi:hypothetical protein FMUND_15899, partial [Fusarium mundagurra]
MELISSTPPAMSQDQFQDAINKACEAAVKKALNSLDNHISDVVTTEVNSREEQLCNSVATQVAAHLKK